MSRRFTVNRAGPPAGPAAVEGVVDYAAPPWLDGVFAHGSVT
jgi:hypothetical protein